MEVAGLWVLTFFLIIWNLLIYFKRVSIYAHDHLVSLSCYLQINVILCTGQWSRILDNKEKENCDGSYFLCWLWLLQGIWTYLLVICGALPPVRELSSGSILPWNLKGFANELTEAENTMVVGEGAEWAIG